MFVAVIVCILAAILLFVGASGFVKSRTFMYWGIGATILGAAFYYAWFLTAGSLRNLFTNDPYSGIYPNLLHHALSGDFGIDPQYAFREYFINDNGMPTVYFGFMPVLIRAIAWPFNNNLYGYNLSNLSVILAIAVAAGALTYSLHRLGLLKRKTRPYAIGTLVALLFASPVVYLAIWGRVHNEVIAWAVAWGIIFVSFYALWIFTKKPKRKQWWAIVLGVSVGMCILSRPTIALTLALPFAYLVAQALLPLIRKRKATDIKILLPGIVCAFLLVCFAMFINYQRWGGPLTFVKMDHHVELLKENPKRGADLREAGEFNINRLPSSMFYYLVPNTDNISKHWPYVELDHSLTALANVPQYDYIEGSRVPIVISMLFLIVAAGYGVVHIRSFPRTELYASVAVLVGGLVTLLALCSVYAVALRYSIDLVPVILFMALLALIVLARQSKPKPLWWNASAYGLLVLSVFLTTVTCLQYKIISGQIGLSNEFREDLARSIHFTPQKDAKIFIINGEPTSIRYW